MSARCRVTADWIRWGVGRSGTARLLSGRAAPQRRRHAHTSARHCGRSTSPGRGVAAWGYGPWNGEVRIPRRSARPAPAGSLAPGSQRVRTDDGVDLHVEVDGTCNAPLTVLLTHGFTARLGEWDGQRAALRGRARLVLWDHRGHGRSAWGDRRTATIDRTARDLAEVLDATTPSGPVVLAGHSLGGMTVLALARQRPELFGPRVVGVFLLATSAGGLFSGGVLGWAIGLARRLGLLPP